MTPNQQREELSKAYVAAVATRCGYMLANWSQDDDCLDVTIGAPSIAGIGSVAGPKIDIQLKCTSDVAHDRVDHVAWSLRRAHHERLRAESLVPIILVVVVLPEDDAQWLTHSSEQLILRRCAYWTSLLGDADFAEGQDSWTVRIPKDNVFSPVTLRELMHRSRTRVPL
jgi:hypothetical protein